MAPSRKEPTKKDFNGRFAIRLCNLRENAGLSAQEFADAIGVKSDQTIYDWESSKSQPKIAVFPAMAKILGVSIRELLPEK